MKLDWKYCAWCYGGSVGPLSERKYRDVRYETGSPGARCANSGCERRDLMPFMRYCPWCNTKVKRRWKVIGCSDKCSRCGCGVVRDYWEVCPWCTISLSKSGSHGRRRPN